jgi:spore germination protein
MTIPRSTRRGALLGAVSLALLVSGSCTELPESRSPSTTSRSPAKPRNRPVIGAWLPHWRQGPALNSFKANASLVSEVSPVWYQARQDSRHEPPRIVPYPHAADSAVVSSVRDAGALLIPTLTNFPLSQMALEGLLNDPLARRAHAASILQLVVDGGYDGIDIDYEHLPVSARDGYSAFVTDVGKYLHHASRKLVVSVPPKLSDEGRPTWVRAWDYRAIGRVADRVRIMAYNLHADDTGPGPMAPVPWLHRVARYAATTIDPGKVELGAPLFGYDWPEAEGVPRSLTYSKVRELSRRINASHQWSPTDGMPWFAYEAEGVSHVVWYANAATVDNALVVAKAHHLAGIALWPLGDEDPAIWTAIRNAT